MLALNLLPDQSVAIKIILCKCVLNIGNKRMLLEHLAVILDHGSLIKLNLLALLFVLVRVLWIFVEALVTIAINTNLESFSGFFQA